MSACRPAPGPYHRRVMRPIAVVLLALALIAPLPAAAQRAVDLRDAVERVQRQTGGRILAAETVRIGRQKVYRIKVLTRDGRVRVVQVPAAGR